jgi:hypothetical protein
LATLPEGLRNNCAVSKRRSLLARDGYMACRLSVLTGWFLFRAAGGKMQRFDQRGLAWITSHHCVAASAGSSACLALKAGSPGMTGVAGSRHRRLTFFTSVLVRT